MAVFIPGYAGAGRHEADTYGTVLCHRFAQRRLRWRRWTDVVFLKHRRRAKKLVMNSFAGHPKAAQQPPVGLHEKSGAAQVDIIVVQRQQALQGLATDQALAVKAVTIRLARIAITEVHFNARAPVGQGQHFIAKPMHRAVFAGVQKVHRAHRLAAQAMQHAQHGRQTDAAAEQHHRPWTLLVQHKGAGWACDVEYVANPHAVVQVVGTLSGRQVLAIERGGFM